MKTSLITGFVSEAFINGGLNEILTMIRNIEILVYLPLINLVFPSNVNLYFKELISLIFYDTADIFSQLF